VEDWVGIFRIFESTIAVVFKIFFVWNCIKMILFIFKKLFLILAHQNNDLKIQKNNLKKK
jgi:hypothetical protein